MFPIEGKYEDIWLRELEPSDEAALVALYAEMGPPPSGQDSGAGWLSHAETTSTLELTTSFYGAVCNGRDAEI